MKVATGGEIAFQKLEDRNNGSEIFFVVISGVEGDKLACGKEAVDRGVVDI